MNGHTQKGSHKIYLVINRKNLMEFVNCYMVSVLARFIIVLN